MPESSKLGNVAEDMPSKLMEDEELRSAVRKAVSLESGCAKALAAKVSQHGPRVSAYYVHTVDMYAPRMASMVCAMWRL